MEATFAFQHKNRTSVLVSTIVHLLLILLAFMPLLNIHFPPPEQGGIAVALGDPDLGDGIAEPDPGTPAASEAPSETPVEEKPVEKSVEPKVVKQVNNNTKVEKQIEREDPDEIQIKEDVKKKAAEKEAAEEAKRKSAEAESKRKAEAEAKKKAESEAKLKAAKDKLGGLLKPGPNGGGGDGTGRGNTGKDGNQGDPNGNPQSDILEGKNTGTGRIGGGLSGRKAMVKPEPDEKSQITGKVVIAVCVDAKGSVTSANYTQRGSTTNDAGLIKAAIDAVKRWKFEDVDHEEQCGTVSFNFKVSK